MSSTSLYGYGNRLTKKEIMDGIESDSSKIIARNTVRFYKNGLRSYRLYHTTILEETKDGVWIDSGRWHSTLTQHRINMALKDMGIGGEWTSGIRVWGYSNHFFLHSPTQSIPLTHRTFVPTNGEIEEASYRQSDKDFRKHAFYASYSYFHPNTIEWDGRTSTLRALIRNRKYPWKFLMLVKGLSLVVEKDTSYNTPPLLTLSYHIGKGKIKMRDVFEAICAAGGLEQYKASLPLPAPQLSLRPEEAPTC